jgi:hypothetical protein
VADLHGRVGPVGPAGGRAHRRRGRRHRHGGRGDDPLEDPLPVARLVHGDASGGRRADVPPPVRPVLRLGDPLLALRASRHAHPPARGVHERRNPAAALRDHPREVERADRCGGGGFVRGRAHRRGVLELLEPRDALHLRRAPLLLGALAAHGDIAASMARREPAGALARVLGRLGGQPARRADAGVGVLAGVRLAGAHERALQARAVRHVVGGVGRADGGDARVVRGPVRARRSDPAVARGGRLARRGQGRHDVRGPAGAQGVDRLQLHTALHPDRQDRRARVPRPVPRHATRRGHLRARDPVRGDGPVRGLQEGRGRPHLLAALLRRVLRAGARAARGNDRPGGRLGRPADGPGARAAGRRRRPRGGARARRRDGARRRGVPLGMAEDRRPLRRAWGPHPEPDRHGVRDD